MPDQAGHDKTGFSGRPQLPLPARVLYGLEQSPLALRPPLAAIAGEVGIAELGSARSDLCREFLVGDAGAGPIGRASRL